MTRREFEVADLARLLNAKIQGPMHGSIYGVAPIASAKKGELTFLVGGSYRKFLKSTQASAVIVAEKDATICPESVTALIVINPESAFAKAIEFFHPPKKIASGVHPTAVVGARCNIHDSATISANCVIADDVTIGPGTVVMPGTIIGEGSRIGAQCALHSRVTIYHHILIGDRVILHAGTVIGADGFGFAQENGAWIKIPQIGRVVIGDDVEIGANTTVDRGALKDTVIAKGVKIDNLVQIGHNVEIGESTIIAGCVGIAGSVTIGKRCMIGGACNISGHLTITDDVIITGAASVINSVDESGIYSSGISIRPHREWLKTVARLGHLDEMGKRITQLEKDCYERNE